LIIISKPHNQNPTNQNHRSQTPIQTQAPKYKHKRKKLKRAKDQVFTSTTETTVATSDEHENLSANQNNFRSFYWLLLVSTLIITIIQESLLVSVASFLRLLLLFNVHSMKIPFKFFQVSNLEGVPYSHRWP
jgi:Flp pilus assembly protein TadB